MISIEFAISIECDFIQLNSHFERKEFNKVTIDCNAEGDE